MTDETRPTPGAVPPPPPGGMAAPPPPPAPGVFVPPGQPPAPPSAPPPTAPAPAAPAPKKKRGVVIAIIIAVLLLCGLGGCAAIYLGLNSGAKDNASIGQAESHYALATRAVDQAGASVKTATAANAAAETNTAIDSAIKSLRTSRDEIASAKASIEAIKQSQGRTDYLASLAAATLAVDSLEDLVAYLGTATGMLAKVTEASAAAKRANDELNSAVSAGNKGSYSSQRTKAAAASADYAKAALLFSEAHKLDPSAELNKAADYSNKRKAQADVVIRMADEGSSGRMSAYNVDVKKMNALGSQAEKMGEPALLSDPQWAQKRLSVLQKQLDEQSTKADELHKKALEELRFTGK